MSDLKGECSRPPIGITREGVGRKAKPVMKPPVLGIELPFDWCLVRGRELRNLQMELRRAKFDAAMRLRMCGQLHKEILRKESR